MKLSNGEKLILLMLSEIYEKLGVDGETDPKFVRSAIISGNEWGLEWKYSGIPFDRQATPKPVKEVVDFLDMWSFIEEAYKGMSSEDKKLMETSAAPFGMDVKFMGFDGNNESEYLNIAHFLIDDMNRFPIFKARELNSHMRSISIYRRMYSVLKRMRKNLTPEKQLNATQIIELLKAKAKTRPDQR